MNHRAPRPSGLWIRALVGCGLVFLWSGSLPAQQVPERAPFLAQSEADETVIQPVRDAISPRGAFIRSLIIPGWGHAAVGAQGRGGFYFLAQSASLWMVAQSHGLRSAARELRHLEASAADERLRGEGVTDPFERRQAVRADPRVVERQELVDTRAQQVEDWVALSVFLLLIISADAFVSAHLMEFPEPLGLEVQPLPGSGRVEVGLRLADPFFGMR